MGLTRIHSGRPRQNTYGERGNRTVRREWLASTSSKAIWMCGRWPTSGAGPRTPNVPIWAPSLPFTA
ncbi:hypothetical protein [Rhodovulum sulfidophilum]|uniref:hypothetical protein n=1 Tax=Rhodovulum sulfidophilum TaxID=35806 RepID=UPI001912B283